MLFIMMAHCLRWHQCISEWAHVSNPTPSVPCAFIHGWHQCILEWAYMGNPTAILIIIEGQFQVFQWVSSSKLVLKIVGSCFEALNYYENGSTPSVLWFSLPMLGTGDRRNVIYYDGTLFMVCNKDYSVSDQVCVYTYLCIRMYVCMWARAARMHIYT
jgi:hypothetical protein